MHVCGLKPIYEKYLEVLWVYLWKMNNDKIETNIYIRRMNEARQRVKLKKNHCWMEKVMSSKTEVKHLKNKGQCIKWLCGNHGSKDVF